MSLLDESRWKKHGERYAMVITDDRENAARLRSSMHDREQCCSRRLWTSMSMMHRETSYTSWVNRNFRCFEKKRQYKHRNGDDCVTSIFSDASKICTVLSNGMITLNGEFCKIVQSTEELIGKIYPELQVNIGNREWLYERVILTQATETVEQINQYVTNGGRYNRISIDKYGNGQLTSNLIFCRVP
ncbi:hypothetical protein AVEN_173016-1 [Araneus ventricosus]|uniref:ATP-dependent DNA helicase n=1 Tax=Araneus ventricosus TaxID=182803 RepID=A0A4Y2W5P9_ARAVE|nr:hypothetical protein AVEN_173016-1 [Araneus ventricosus]